MKLIKTVFVDKTDNLILQLFRYGFVGGIAFVVDIGVLFFLSHYYGVHYLLSAAISFVCGLTINYLISVLWVFNGNRNKCVSVEFLIFSLIGIMGLLLNEFIMYLMSDMLGIYYLISKLISTAIVFFYNFFARKFTVFYSSNSSK